MTVAEVRVVDELRDSDVLVYNYKDAGRVIGLSYGSVRNEMIRGNIRSLEGWKLISRDELIRWIRQREKKPSPRKRAKRIDGRTSEPVSVTA